jgi:hypothetical protein
MKDALQPAPSRYVMLAVGAGASCDDPTGEKARAVKARYRGVCRGCGAYTQPRNGYVARHISVVLFPTGLCGR